VSSGLKQRIVGALVLGALGLIILPVLFDFADPSRVDRTSKLPPVPDIKAVAVAKAQRPVELSDQPLKKPIFDVQKSTSAADVDEKAYGLNDKGLPKAWQIKVGSFSDKANASELVKRLRSGNHKAFSKKVMVQNKAYHQVFVGPYVHKRRALDNKAEIDSAYGVSADVVIMVP
jgi:DedD protein